MSISPGSTSLPLTSTGSFAGPGRGSTAHRGDAARPDRDVEDAVEALRRVDDAAASQEEVVGLGLHDIHGGDPR